MLRKYLPPVAWAWIIIVGSLMITPGGVICLTCGVSLDVAGYVGRPAVMVIGAVSVLLGIGGFATMKKAGPAQT